MMLQGNQYKLFYKIHNCFDWLIDNFNKRAQRALERSPESEDF